MGKLTNLKSFPQFSVDFGDNSSSKTITESALFALDSLLYVMNLSLPIQAYPNALIAFSLHHTHPVCYRESNLIILSCDKNKWNQATYQLAHEICHLMISGEVVSELCWLEESICELSYISFCQKSPNTGFVLVAQIILKLPSKITLPTSKVMSLQIRKKWNLLTYHY